MTGLCNRHLAGTYCIYSSQGLDWDLWLLAGLERWLISSVDRVLSFYCNMEVILIKLIILILVSIKVDMSTEKK